MELHNITIKQLKEQGEHTWENYGDSLIITDRITEIERFHAPCRIDAATIIVCTQGTIDCTINLRQYHITPGMVIVTPSDDILQIQRSENLNAYALIISSEFLAELKIDYQQRSDFYMEIRNISVCPMPEKAIRNLRPYYELISHNLTDRHSETHSVLCGLVKAFICTVMAYMRRYHTAEEAPERSSLPRNKILFNKFMALVKKHHTEARGVRFYADMLCLTPNYLSGVVKEYTGKTATKWVNDYVILEAKILLRDTSKSVQEIAYRLHFANQSAFGKYFNKLTGMSPKQYRNTSR